MPLSPGRSTLLLLFGIGLSFLATGCAERDRFPTELEPQEQRLVDEVLALIEVRIARARDADEAEAKRQALGDLLDDEEIAALLKSLGEKPERGHLVMSAIHDSLVARREQLLPPQVED